NHSKTTVWFKTSCLKMSHESDDSLSMRISLLIAALFVSANSFAGERYHFYNGVRQMGMGGASVATVNDETALIANPAALGKLRDYFVTVFDPDLDVGVAT